MRLILAILTCIVVATVAVAAQAPAAEIVYDISVKIQSNGDVLSDARFIVQDGNQATIEQEKTFTEIIAQKSTGKSANSVHLTVVTGVRGVDGGRTTVTNSEMNVALDKTATISIAKLTNPSEKITLSVTPKLYDAPEN